MLLVISLEIYSSSIILTIMLMFDVLANGGCLKFEDEFIQRCMTIIGGASKHLNMVCIVIMSSVSLKFQFELFIVWDVQWPNR